MTHDLPPDFEAREHERTRGMSNYIVRYGVLRYGLPLVAISLVVLAIEGRLATIDLETFVVRGIGPLVFGLLLARMGWAKIVRARLERLEARVESEGGETRDTAGE